jgi:hypothetical protein
MAFSAKYCKSDAEIWVGRGPKLGETRGRCSVSEITQKSHDGGVE